MRNVLSQMLKSLKIHAEIHIIKKITRYLTLLFQFPEL